MVEKENKEEKKKALEKVCRYKSEIKLVEIGRQNLTNDIDNEVMPLINKEKKEKENFKACSKCGSGQTYVRIKEGSRVCRSCGYIDPIND